MRQKTLVLFDKDIFFIINDNVSFLFVDIAKMFNVAAKREKRKEDEGNRQGYEGFKKDSDILSSLAGWIGKINTFFQVKSTIEKVISYINTQPEKDRPRLLAKTKEDMKQLFLDQIVQINDILYFTMIIEYISDCLKFFWENITPYQIVNDGERVTTDMKEKYTNQMIQELNTDEWGSRSYTDFYQEYKLFLSDDTVIQNNSKRKQNLCNAIQRTFKSSDSLESATYASLEGRPWDILRLWLLTTEELIEEIANGTKIYILKKMKVIKDKIVEEKYISNLLAHINSFESLWREKGQWDKEYVKNGIEKWKKEAFQENPFPRNAIKEKIDEILEMKQETISYLSDSRVKAAFVQQYKIYSDQERDTMIEAYKLNLEDQKREKVTQ